MELVFPQEPGGTATTFAGAMHFVMAGIASLGTMIAILSLGLWFRKFPDLKGYVTYSLISVSIIFISGGLSAAALAYHSVLFGLIERITILTFTLWIFVIGREMAQLEGKPLEELGKSLFHYFWKVPICGLAFFIGLVLGSLLATWMRLPTPTLPIGADQSTVLQYTLLGSLILSVSLANLARGLSGSFVSRWLILFFLMWIANPVNNYFEAAIFTTMSAAALYAIVMYLPTALLCGAAVAWLFPSDTSAMSFFANVRTFFASHTPDVWIWRLLVAFLAFPLIYYAFRNLIAPFVLDYYQQGSFELTLPGWNQILSVLAIRSLLFLLACLPVLIAWQKSGHRLFVALGLTLFFLVGGVNMLQAYWLPPSLRLVHSLEIFADEIVYAGALVVLLIPKIQLSHRPQTRAIQSNRA
jgi:Protein of unknown function (DUF998)